MKTGFEDRRKVYLVAALAVVAIFLLWRWMSSSGSPAEASSPAAPATRRAAPPMAALRPKGGKGQSATANLDPSLRFGALKAVESQEYQGSGRNIFEYAEVRLPKPIKPVVPSCAPHCPPVNPQPIVTPQPAPIPLKFYGFANRPGEPLRVFLSQGEDIFIAGEGDIVNRHFKVVHIGKSSVEIEDVMTNYKQSIPLSQS
ncbi:MAG TPA: hypothetical protein VFZ99_03960 [Terriglobales bacterium]